MNEKPPPMRRFPKAAMEMFGAKRKPHFGAGMVTRMDTKPRLPVPAENATLPIQSDIHQFSDFGKVAERLKAADC